MRPVPCNTNMIAVSSNSTNFVMLCGNSWAFRILERSISVFDFSFPARWFEYSFYAHLPSASGNTTSWVSSHLIRLGFCFVLHFASLIVCMSDSVLPSFSRHLPTHRWRPYVCFIRLLLYSFHLFVCSPLAFRLICKCVLIGLLCSTLTSTFFCSLSLPLPLLSSKSGCEVQKASSSASLSLPLPS